MGGREPKNLNSIANIG